MGLRFHNTLTRRSEEFEPREGNEVGLYTCGPTVYDYAHIGNFRAYVFEDILRRVLKFEGYRVTQVMNLTDVDDKTIRGAVQGGISLAQYTAKYIAAFFDDLKMLNIEPAEHYPAATAHIPEMLDIIQKLFERGYAYTSGDGSVYFNVSKCEGYGRLAHLDLAGLKAGARVVQDEYDKENVSDFALWKAWDEADGDIAWDSPWGRGRPGWHVECSAMSTRYLGESFDIHTGGVDNIFPHHENEIAQSEGASGKPFVHTWLHCAHLMVDGQKMAKSSGNFYTLRDIAAKGYSGREIRYVLMGAHYRQQLNFTFEALNGARAALGRLDDFMARLSAHSAGAGRACEVPAWVTLAKTQFVAGIRDDLNMAGALAALFDLVHTGNKAMDDGSADAGAAGHALALLEELDAVLGVLKHEEARPDQEVDGLLEARAAARASRDWPESDRLRDELAGLGWEVRDTPEGQKLKRL